MPPPYSFKTKPTILQVIPALGSGGVEIETLIIAKAIAEAGGRSLIVSGTEKNNQDGIEFIKLPLATKNPLQLFKNVALLKELIHKENVSLVHARSRAPAWSAYRATRNLNVPFITTYHAAYPSKSTFKTFYNSVMARGDRVIAISHFIKQHLLEAYKDFSWFDPSKIHLVERGVDLNYFDPETVSETQLNSLRKMWNISPKTRVLLLPGRISRKKGQDVLIKALFLMKHRKVTVVFLGSAGGHQGYRDTLLQQITTLNLKERVKWIDPFPDLPTAYKLADIILCPSLAPEGFGRVMAEAQAMKKPIVASDHGAACELIEEGVTGLRTPPGDPEALALALDTLLDVSPTRLQAMGEKGRARANAYYSEKDMKSKTIELYKECLE